MKKKVIAVFIFLSIFVSNYALSDSMLETARDAVILIETEGPSGSGFGSGFLVSDDGYIVTNYHIVHRQTGIKIWFYDEKDPKVYIAEIIGVDGVSDVALLKMDLKPDMLPLTYLEIESENINIGDRVFVIGHLLGLDWTITSGIVSHSNRVSQATSLVRLIQIDAAINRGNSGGPIINEDGKVVGIITTTRFDERGRTVGVGNGVRGDHLNKIILDLMDDGLVSRPAMQTKFRHLTPWTIVKIREKNPGAVIPDVFGLISIEIKEDSYPYEQGLRNFDILISVNGTSTTNIYELGDILNNSNIGDILDLTVIREGVTMNFPYVLKNLEFDYLKYFDERGKRLKEPKSDVSLEFELQ